MKRATMLALVLALLGSSEVAAQPAEKYRPAAADRHDPYSGRYVVTVSAGEDVGALAPVLAATYGGRLEPYAREGGSEFMVVLSENRARLLSSDGRVVRVEEIPRAVPSEESAVPVRETAVAAENIETRPVTNATTSWALGYSYDPSGNVTAISGDSFRYDKVGRLQTSVVNGLAQDATYDAFGNIRKLTTNGVELLPGVRVATNRISKRVDPGVCTTPSRTTTPRGTSFPTTTLTNTRTTR